MEFCQIPHTAGETRERGFVAAICLSRLSIIHSSLEDVHTNIFQSLVFFLIFTASENELLVSEMQKKLGSPTLFLRYSICKTTPILKHWCTQLIISLHGRRSKGKERGKTSA